VIFASLGPVRFGQAVNALLHVMFEFAFLLSVDNFTNSFTALCCSVSETLARG